MTDGGHERAKPALGNIPLQNLREEFLLYLETLSSDRFAHDLRYAMHRPIRTPLFDWHGAANDLLTLIVQRAVQGLEAYVGGAAWIEINRAGLMTQDILKLVRNPFGIKGERGTAAAYYHKLPGLLSPMLSLQILEPKLWPAVKLFYAEVRNPLFHGMQLQRNEPDEVLEYFRLIEQVYQWIDYWHTPSLPWFPTMIVLRPRSE